MMKRVLLFVIKHTLRFLGVQAGFIGFVFYVIYACFAVTTGLEDAKIIPPTETEQDRILKIMPEYIDGDVWVYGIWQDFTVYGEYKYPDLSGYFNSESNTLFKSVDDEMLAHFHRFYPNYKNWVDCTDGANERIGDDLTKVYRFDTDCMDTSDWYYYESGGDDSHTYYYFDTQSHILYLLHYNT